MDAAPVPTAAPSPAAGDEKKKKKGGGPPDGRVITPKPKLSKAERRALQEAQRAAKAARQQGSGDGGGDDGGKGCGKGGGGGDQQKQQQQQQQKKSSSDKNDSSSSPSAPSATSNQNKQQYQANKSAESNSSKNRWPMSTMDSMFAHLPSYKDLPNRYAPEFTTTLHPDVIDLGMKYACGEINGDNARCRAMLHCFMNVLRDYNYTSDVDGKDDYKSHLDHQVLKASFQFWTSQCRPHCVSMGNAFTFLKSAVASLERDMPLVEAKALLTESMERYLVERLDVANQAMAEHAMKKLTPGDVVLTFGYSEAVAKILINAHQEHGLTDMAVWICDAGPQFSGKEMLKTLQEAGVRCGYALLHSISYVLPHVTKVFLGASALFSNGSIYAPAGTACVALLATQDSSNNIPTLVCCETYKISNKVQLESITHNELGDPEALSGGSKKGDDVENLKRLNLLYDVTPSEYVSGIVTELGIIPPTSVAVLLREMNPQDAAYRP
mmetsp:Transcript_45745/g.111520  ORF Transcript_45745/g.111520 Transcript_45745/m.111520 type:complete len:496 (-) Transcript_45745:2572-4059(-)